MSKTILLVEDEALIALSEAQILKKHGYEVITVHSGERAVETVETAPEISLILTTYRSFSFLLTPSRKL